MRYTLSVLFALSFALASTHGAEPEDTYSSTNIRLELQVVAIPEKIAIPLVMQMKDKEKIEAANAKIQQMVVKGTAKLIGWPILTTRSGQRSIYDAIKEIRYATEYHPPTVGVAPNTPTDEPVAVKPTVDVTTFDGVPAAFETRNVGVSFEVEAALSPDLKKIDLNIVPQTVRLEGYHKVTIEGAARKGKVVVEQPQFDVHRTSTSLTMRNGERMLLGVYRTDDPPGHLELFILKAELLSAE